MKVAVLTETRMIKIKDVEKPRIREDEVLIKVKATGICGSDLHAYRGIHAFRKPPVILGHEVSGIVEEVGKQVKNINIGDRVTVEPLLGCGECESCFEGRYNICKNKKVPGIGGWNGTFAEYFVAHKKCIHKIPNSMSYLEGALIEPLSVGVHAVRRANIRLGDTVAILGAGTIGLMCLIASKQAGASKVYVTDVIEGNLKKAKELGADVCINSRKDSIYQLLEEAPQNVIDTVIITAAFPPVWEEAARICKNGGEICVIGMFQKPVSVDLLNLMLSEKNICTSNTYVKEDYKIAIQIAEKTDLMPIITHQLPLKETSRGFEILEKKIDDPIKIMLIN